MPEKRQFVPRIIVEAAGNRWDLILLPLVLAIIVLYSVTATLGAIVYLYFRVDIRPALEQAGRFEILGFFDLKEHFIAIGLALLPAYFVCWRQPREGESTRTRTALTSILAFIVWWGFLVGHVTNNIKGVGA